MNPAPIYQNKTFPSFFLIGICLLFCFSGRLAWAQPYQELKGWVGQNPFEGTGAHQGQSLYQDKPFQNIFLGLLKNNMPSQQAEEIWDNILKQSDKAQIVQAGSYVVIIGFNCRWQGCPEHHIFFTMR